MIIIFFGNTKYSAIVANHLHKKLGLRVVVTIPDRANKRGKALIPNPVKIFALKNSIEVIETEKFNKSIIRKIQNFKPDFFVVSDYGLILPMPLLKIPHFVAINVHHSLLPKFRGPAPAPAAILSGVQTSGVTIIKMNDKVDAGDILKQKKYIMKSDETTDTLLIKLNELGSEMVIDVINNYNKIIPMKQNESEATFTKRLSKLDGFIDYTNPPDSVLIHRMIRAYYPWPVVWSKYILNNSEVRIKLYPKNIIQIEGKNPITYKDFINGYSGGKIFLEKLHLLKNN